VSNLESFANYARDAAASDECDARHHFEDFVGRADTCLAVRDALSITDWLGRQSYLRDRDPYTGPFDPNELDQVFFCLRRFLADAETAGMVYETLGRLGVTSKEEWWRVEATYYRAHFGHLSETEGRAAFAAAAEHLTH
jgi:hypothetical protein